MRKKWAMMLTCVCMSMMMLAGCGDKSKSETEAVDITENEATVGNADEEDYSTGDASLDNTRNQDEIGDTELLVVSFGTSYNENRRLTIGAIEDAFDDAFGDKYSVRRGFTSQIVIDHIYSRDHVKIDNVTEALERAVNNDVKTLIIQPTHIMDGYEYNDLVDEVAQYADAFDKISIGAPLLTSDEDFQAVMEAITSDTEDYDDGETAICFMGHGTEAKSNAVYEKLQTMLKDAGYDNYYIGTVEAEPSLEDVIAQVNGGSYKRVVLQPLMIVAGDHANNDMAGSDEDTWKTKFEEEGYEVVCLIKGLGEIPAIRDIFVQHAQNAIDEAEMTPIYAEDIVDGTYNIKVDSSSSMFNIVDCTLVVENGTMTATMTMGGTGYLYVFMGTGEEAAGAEDSSFIPFEEIETGEHTFTVPVDALNKKIPVAAYSKRKEQWYDRDLVFRADSLPGEAYSEETFVKAEDVFAENGTYLVDVTLQGGSGKASISSPANVVYENGVAIVTLEWSSKNYDYMIVDEKKYECVNTDGNSVFEIPILCFDFAIPVRANTTAMSTPHEIDYTLTFDLASVKKVE